MVVSLWVVCSGLSVEGSLTRRVVAEYVYGDVWSGAFCKGKDGISCGVQTASNADSPEPERNSRMGESSNQQNDVGTSENVRGAKVTERSIRESANIKKRFII
jgi:hypothetical protein